MLALVSLTSSCKLLECIGLGHFLANNRLLLASQFFHFCFDGGEVALLYHLSVGQQHVVEESILDCRAETELHARIQLLKCLGQQVGGGVPEGVLSFLVFELVECNGSILGDGTVQLYSLTVYTTAYNAARQSR